MKQFLNGWLILYFCMMPMVSFCDSIALSGNPATLTINSATAGQNPNSITNTSTTYNVVTTTVVRVITGKINTAMPSNATLTVGLAAPSGAATLGSVTMTTVAANLVTGIPKNTTTSSLTVTYTLSATAAAAQVTNATKTLTLTLQ